MIDFYFDINYLFFILIIIIYNNFFSLEIDTQVFFSNRLIYGLRLPLSIPLHKKINKKYDKSRVAPVIEKRRLAYMKAYTKRLIYLE